MGFGAGGVAVCGAAGACESGRGGVWGAGGAVWGGGVTGRWPAGGVA